jgi:hypothetical protein
MLHKDKHDDTLIAQERLKKLKPLEQERVAEPLKSHERRRK